MIVPGKRLWGGNNNVCMYVFIQPVVTTVDVVNTPLALFNCERHSMLFLPGSYGNNLRISADVFLSTDAGMSWHMVGLLSIPCQQKIDERNKPSVAAAEKRWGACRLCFDAAAYP